MRAPRLKPAPPEAAQRTQRSLQGEDDARGAASLRQHVHLLPLVQHDLLAAEQGLAPEVTESGLRGAHEAHDPLLHLQLGHLLLAQGVHGHKLTQVVAGHCQRGRVRAAIQEQRRQHVQRPEVVLLKLQDVLCPELGGVDETPSEDARLELPLIPVEVAQRLDLRGDQRGHVADVLVEFRVAPLLELQLLHGLEHALLHDLLRQGLVREEVPEHGEAEPHDLLGARDGEDLLDLLDGGIALQLCRDFRVEGEHPDSKHAPVLEGRGVGAGLDLENAVGHARRGPDAATEDVGLQEVGDGLQDSELRAMLFLGLQQLSQQCGDVVLREEARHLPDDTGEQPSRLVRNV
mmetsp:Transcript_6958/g.21626  ORF Transcript_6958/g.21626 Transcript_6958/m.21626 type:complete len:347 (-) Transcript_6958:473-1513(-)